MHLLLTLTQNLDQTAQVQHPPRPKPQVRGKALSRRTSPFLTPCGAFPSPLDPILPLISSQCSKIRISLEGSPYTRHLKRKRDENEDTTVEEMSQTQEDSQGSFYAFTHHAYNILAFTFLLALTFWQPSTPSQRERASARRHSFSSCPPTPEHPPALHSPPPTKRPRRGPEPTVTASASTVTVQTISRYKSARRRDDDEPPALNAEFEIDPAANAGVPFAFDEVVRGRRHRHRLIAGECEECRGVSNPSLPRITAFGVLTVRRSGMLLWGLSHRV
jgi:hypothetical protein